MNEAQFHSSKQCDIFFPVTERPLFWKHKDGSDQPSGYKSLLRKGEKDEPIVLAAVKESYKLVSNKEVHDALQPILAGHSVEERFYMDQQGARCYMDYTFTKMQYVLRGHPINFRAIFYNGYGGSAFGAKIGAINFFCLNGMIIGEHESSYHRHTSGLDCSIASRWLAAGMMRLTGQHEQWAQLLEQHADREYALNRFGEMTDNEKHIERMEEVYLSKYRDTYGPNRFAVYQTLTDFASHYDDYKLRAVNNNAPHQREHRLLARAERIMAQAA